MELDEIVNQIIEESGKLLVTVKPELRYKIGTEIETTIEGKSCDDCDYCEICDNCPVCLNCQEHRLYCQNCDKEEIREYAIEEGYIDEDEDINICDICQEYNLYSTWTIFITMNLVAWNSLPNRLHHSENTGKP